MGFLLNFKEQDKCLDFKYFSKISRKLLKKHKVIAFLQISNSKPFLLQTALYLCFFLTLLSIICPFFNLIVRINLHGKQVCFRAIICCTFKLMLFFADK